MALTAIVLALLGFSVILYCAAWNLGGVVAASWNLCIAGVAGVSLALSLVPARTRGRTGVAPLPAPVPWLCCAIFCIALFQLMPLPQSLLGLLSPVRRQLLDAAAAVTAVPAWAPLHAMPAEGYQALRNMACYGLVFLAVRHIAGQERVNPWYCVAPLVVLGAAEAGLGLAQWHAGEAVAHGTFYDSDHFAGLLEMVLPFPLMWALDLASVRRGPAGLALRAALLIVGLLAAAVLMLAGVVHSLSRMGFLASLAALCASALAAVPPGRASRRWLMAGVLALTLAAFLFLPGPALVRRYASLARQPVVQDPRFQLWAGSLALIRDYPLLGCGLGAYQSCALRYKTAVPTLAVSHAHNDYLELAAGIGVPGCAVVIVLGFLAWREALRASRRNGRFAAAACVGSLLGMAGHSLVDFNLHIPANALVFAWILGLATSFRRVALK